MVDCLNGTRESVGGKHGPNKYKRRDTIRLFALLSGVTYADTKIKLQERDHAFIDPVVDKLADQICAELTTGQYTWPPIEYRKRHEHGKDRRIGIENIYQQFFDYIAVIGLQDAFKRIGEHQYASVPGRGQLKGMRTIQRWLRQPSSRYAWKGDVHHYYQSVNREKLMFLLSEHVDNERLLDLTRSLIYSYEEGLSIGSYLSQYLANFYMSYAYHYALEELRLERNSKRQCKVITTRPINHCLIYMDDILFISANKSDLKRAVRIFNKWMHDELGLEIKHEVAGSTLPGKIIDLTAEHGAYIDMMGYVISKDRVITRPGIFRRQRRDINEVMRTRLITPQKARAIISRDGWLKNARTAQWRKDNDMQYILTLCKYAAKDNKPRHYYTPTERAARKDARTREQQVCPV